MELNWKVNNQLLCYANFAKKGFEKLLRHFVVKPNKRE